MNNSEYSGVSLERRFRKNREEVLLILEDLICKIRYYETVKNKSKIESEVVNHIHWVADFLPRDMFPYRIDTIINALWTRGIGLRNRWLEIKEIDKIKLRNR